MPRKNGGFNAQEKRFVDVQAATGNPVYAAAMAGYRHPGPRATQNMLKPAVQTAVKTEQMRRLTNELLPLALDTLQTALTDDKVPWGAKMTGVKITLDRVYGADDKGERKDPSEMSADELQQAIERLRQEAGNRAKTIEAKADETPETGAFD